MPEFTVKEVRVPELHLPEIKREDIVRTLSGARLPEIDMAKARRASIKVPSVTLSGSDVGRLLAAGATIGRLIRPTPSRRPWRMGPFARRAPSPIERIVQPKRRRSRRPLVIAVIAMVAIGAWAILRRPDVRRRIDLAISDARTRMAQRRADRDDTAMAVREPVAVMATTPPTAIEGVASPADDVASTPMSETPDMATESDAIGTPSLEERASAG
jgi:hypothetical protein